MSLWVNVITAASGLVGAGVGFTGTLLSERWRARESAEQERTAAARALREERKDVLVRFFASVRELERAAERAHAGQEVAGAAELTSRLWLLHVEVYLLCGEPVADAVHDLTERLTEAVREPTGVPVHARISAARRAALEAAHGELRLPASARGHRGG
ncbi:hypothetical protein C6N75_13645 [Streptomyces solincola]|uniref:Uncharacterized protein n=1 Tax=Streptomyces solincola TaxID=2100817 RepID=A0A2S9PW88_9ACTN|nr:hypothetical protein [Streptomyces solincola]PRH78681.1 hypothetical protein C6N75_13645 [Streptomyces solincola]